MRTWVVFIKVANNLVVKGLRGTAEENGFTTYPLKGYTIQPKHLEELAVSIRASASGNHTATRMLFTHSYLGVRYQFAQAVQISPANFYFLSYS
jgi:hypothetical protein